MQFNPIIDEKHETTQIFETIQITKSLIVFVAEKADEIKQIVLLLFFFQWSSSIFSVQRAPSG